MSQFSPRLLYDLSRASVGDRQAVLAWNLILEIRHFRGLETELYLIRHGNQDLEALIRSYGFTAMIPLPPRRESRLAMSLRPLLRECHISWEMPALVVDLSNRQLVGLHEALGTRVALVQRAILLEQSRCARLSRVARRMLYYLLN